MMVNQRVICVDDSFPEAAFRLYVALPVKDTIYVIRGVCVGVNWALQPGEVCVYLRGLHNPRSSRAPFAERGFNAERFRPLEEDEIKAVELVREPAYSEPASPKNGTANPPNGQVVFSAGG